MPIEITMPRLSDTMEEGTLLHWYKKVGDVISSGDVLADIETDKATMELQSFDDGIFSEIIVQEGEKVGVGKVIALLTEEDESPAPEVSEPEPAPIKQDHEQGMTISPIARRLADEYKIDVHNIQGSGPSGRYQLCDLPTRRCVAVPRDLLQVLQIHQSW